MKKIIILIGFVAMLAVDTAMIAVGNMSTFEVFVFMVTAGAALTGLLMTMEEVA
jgi:hypothetical protein